MKKILFLLGISGLCLCQSNSLIAVFEIDAEEDTTLGQHEKITNPKKRNEIKVAYDIKKREGIKSLIFKNSIELKEDFKIRTPFSVIFKGGIKCDKLIIEFTQDADAVTNDGELFCQGLQLVHKKHLIYLYNNKKIVLKKKMDNPLEVKIVNLKDYILVNNGKFFSDCGLKFTWNKELPKELLTYGDDEARIQNYGVIKSNHNIQLGVPVFIGENGIIKTDRKSRIKYLGGSNYPIYAIIRIPEDLLLSYMKKSIAAAQLGEESAKYYYAEFEHFLEGNEIGTFKANNSDNGLDVICNGYPVVIHESKNYSDSTFKLTKSTTTEITQCSKEWLKGHFSEMFSAIQRDKMIIKEAEKKGLENSDPIISKMIKEKKESVKFYESVIAHLKLKEEKVDLNLKKLKLILNGNSIQHINPSLENVCIPTYYCQRNIDAAYSK